MSSLTKLFIKKYPEFEAILAVNPKNHASLNSRFENIRHELRHAIRGFKREFKSDKTDLLADKLEKFGNKGDWSKHQLEILSKMIFAQNKVDNIEPGNALSIEIECVFPSTRRYEKFISLIKQAGIKRNVQVKSDASIQCDSDDQECSYCGSTEGDSCEECPQRGEEIGKEIVVTFDKNDSTSLRLVCDFLTQTFAYVNKSCGLHVHFDMRNKSAAQVEVIARKLAKVVPLLKLMLPESRRNNRFCRADISNRSERYAFINKCSYQKHGTLEIRGHSGTTDFVKITNWIRLINLIMVSRPVKATTFFQMLAEIGCPNDLYDYCKERYYKFGSNKIEGLPEQLVGNHITIEESEQVAA